MVTTRRRARQSGSLIVEALVALGILSVASLPLLSVYVFSQRSLRNSYQRGVAMELIDGEMEVLLAGEWREYHPGPQPCELHGDALKNLPSGHAQLTVTGRHLRLEWLPDRPVMFKIVREADAK